MAVSRPIGNSVSLNRILWGLFWEILEIPVFVDDQIVFEMNENVPNRYLM